ncbi:helix-turn-helix transcriptional regulator [Streptomyces griseocarneus]|nr:helix-turn-helix transcriptional regulator [Streptomyces griseocarneus]MBZ6472293.1 helix-turn-helix transcriptional regulator [Streptomyces griseocarneus]GHG72779.1 DNA-binding protein [Streptomyces griseocarneus]
MVIESRAAAYAAARPDEVRRHELAAFLRSRRERISPERAGLPRGPRRRTPGLRREEVAQLAAVGVTWYTWLEQARDIQVSAQVLDSVARALMLDRAERAHLFALAGSADPRADTECGTITPALRLMLERLEPFPACLQNARYDILAYNRAYGQLLCDLDEIPPEDRNCLWLYFTHPAWRTGTVDWEEATRAMAAKFRASMADHLAEPAWKCLLKRLQDASPEFRRVWERHEVVQPTAHRTRVLRQPQVGPLRLDYTSLWTGPTPGARVLTFTPADEETHDRLLKLSELTSAMTSVMA